MITLPLHIRNSPEPRREPSAWFVPGTNSQAWLAELLAWGVPLAAVRVYLVPQSRVDLAPRGVLVVPPTGCRPRVSRRCQAYGLVGTHLYLPVEAWLDPAVTNDEIEDLLGPAGQIADLRDHGRLDTCPTRHGKFNACPTYLWHPVAGLVRFEPEDARRVADLLEAPAEADGTTNKDAIADKAWDRAEPGIGINRRLFSIVPETSPTPETVLMEGREDIGTEGASLEELPPSPNEPSSGALGAVGRAARRGLARLMQAIAEAAQGGAGKGGRLGNWARRQLAQLNDALHAARHREVLRLMHLLKTNPDEGLRHALRLAGEGHRGLAPPSSRLGRHDTDFNLTRLGGGGPGDPWVLPADFYQQLRAKYFELASRELRLGRYRRAAYIYGELLGDLPSAASALTAGRHWREAAVLYRERLARPDQAARCLEQGGLWTEAAALYEELGDFEKAGDIYTQLDQPESAVRLYRLAITAHLRRVDYLAAAKLLESKLHAPDEALAQLAAAWPHSHQAAKCLEQSFLLLGRLGRHEAALGQIESLRSQSLPNDRICVLAETLAAQASSYPNDAVRAIAADVTRTVAAGRLRAASPHEKDRLVGAVRRLVPGDRLLGRDCERFLRPPSRPDKPKATPGRAARNRPALVREFPLGHDVDWQCAVSAGTLFYAAGYRDKGLVLEQGLWDGTHQREQWQCLPTAAALGDPILLSADARGREPIFVYVIGRPPLFRQSFRATDQHRQRVRAGTPRWMPPDAVGIAQSEKGVTYLVAQRDHALVLHVYSLRDEPVDSRIIPFSDIWPEPVDDLPVLPVPMLARANAVYLGLGDQLVVLNPEHRREIVHVPGVIHSLSGSAPLSRTRVAAGLEEGAVLYWTDDGHLESFAAGLAQPAIGLTRSGWLVAADQTECQIYRTDGNMIRQEAMVAGRGAGRPIAVLAADDPDQFALLAPDGILRLYQMPRRS